MGKYKILVNILDELRKEAPPEFKTYHPLDTETEKLDKARSKSYIHLFLKVKFGLLDFNEREKYVTDDTQDGGVDAYYIDHENKKIYYVQSKFRTNEKNFQNKDIELQEVLEMQIDRMLDGEITDKAGAKYNAKIQKLINEVQNVEGIGRYKHIVIILANLKKVKESDLKKLTGFPTELYDFNKSYQELVFPVVSGTYFNISDLYININLTNKESSASKINYNVQTEFKECDITVLFVPTVEIAKNLYKYKNSLLKFNPRSYLDLSTNPVNKEIASTITEKDTNEFALFNNGITMLSDETKLSERIGKKGQGQLYVKNPQIINGGQTAYTLSKIYESVLNDGKDIENIFIEKEVMLKVITFSESADSNIDINKRLKLIESISKATNQQTPVLEADRRSNDEIQIEIQKAIYDGFGYFYERKRGEFYDGLVNKYIDSTKVINRDLFLRICYACHGYPAQARSLSSKKIFEKNTFDNILKDSSRYRDYFFGYLCNKAIENIQSKFNKEKNNKFGVANYGFAVRYGKMATISVAYSRGFNQSLKNEEMELHAIKTVDSILNEWLKFEEYVKKQKHNKYYFYEYTDPTTNDKIIDVNYDGYYKGKTINADLKEYFKI